MVIVGGVSRRAVAGMDRNVKVEYSSGGPNARAVYLLDSMEARA